MRDQIVRVKRYEKVPLILVGNKVDLEPEREVMSSEGRALAQEWGCPFMETSAKSKSMVDELFAESDVVSLHCPLTPSTKDMVNKSRLEIMKSNAILINTGRGPLVNEQDLADALNEGRIAAAGLDVLSVEPSDSNNPLLCAKNCFITPHIAWATKEARTRLMDIAVNNLKSYIQGTIINNVAV